MATLTASPSQKTHPDSKILSNNTVLSPQPLKKKANDRMLSSTVIQKQNFSYDFVSLVQKSESYHYIPLINDSAK